MYIAGSGRSGSTLLSQLLTQNQDVFNLGQLRDLWKAHNDHLECSCGETVDNCTIWKYVCREAVDGKFKTEFLHSETRRFIRTVKNLSIEEFNNDLEILRTEFKDLCAAMRRGLNCCREITGASVFVDVSKSPEMVLLYILIGDVEVHLVNLVRDCRAVACSWERKDGNRNRIPAFSADWKQRMLVLRKWRKYKLVHHHLDLRYEDFSRKPMPYIYRLLESLSVQSVNYNFENNLHVEISWARQHLFPPINEEILSNRQNRVKILESSHWKELHNLPTHFMALRHSFPQGLLYALGIDGGEYLK